MTIQEFIKKRPYLIWYVKDYNSLSEAKIVESVLNYGNWNDVLELIKILGIQKTAAIFKRQISQKRCNYYPVIKNYFHLYFNKYA